MWPRLRAAWDLTRYVMPPNPTVPTRPSPYSDSLSALTAHYSQLTPSPATCHPSPVNVHYPSKPHPNPQCPPLANPQPIPFSLPASLPYHPATPRPAPPSSRRPQPGSSLRPAPQNSSPFTHPPQTAHPCPSDPGSTPLQPHLKSFLEKTLTRANPPHSAPPTTHPSTVPNPAVPQRHDQR